MDLQQRRRRYIPVQIWRRPELQGVVHECIRQHRRYRDWADDARHGFYSWTWRRFRRGVHSQGGNGDVQHGACPRVRHILKGLARDGRRRDELQDHEHRCPWDGVNGYRENQRRNLYRQQQAVLCRQGCELDRHGCRQRRHAQNSRCLSWQRYWRKCLCHRQQRHRIGERTHPYRVQVRRRDDQLFRGCRRRLFADCGKHALVHRKRGRDRHEGGSLREGQRQDEHLAFHNPRKQR